MVTVQDLGGNTVTTNTSAVTLALTVPGSATLTCTTNPQAAVAGVATFAGCKIDLASTYTLTATDGALVPAVSGSVVITVGAATKLMYLLQPLGNTAGSQFSQQPSVKIADAGGNTVTGNTSSVLLSVQSPAGEVFACTDNPVVAVAGVADFSSCTIDLAGTYVLVATDGVLIPANSNSFTMS